MLSPVGAVYTVTQRSQGRFVDAHEVSANDFGVVTRPNQNIDGQRWVLLPSKQPQWHSKSSRRLL